MHVERLSIRNIRSLRRFTLELDPVETAGWHVLLGDNGAGKSTIVRSLALALMGGPNAHATRRDWERWITHDRRTAVVEAVLGQHREDQWTGSGRTSDDPIAVKVEIGARSASLPHNGPRAAPIMAGKFADRTVWGGGGGWFSASFGPFRRFSGADPEMDRLYLTHPRLAPHLTAFGENVALGESLRWLTNLKVKNLQGDHEARRIEESVVDFINGADLLPHGARVREVTGERVVIEDGSGSPVAIDEMSDGHRSILSLTLELMRLMFAFYPTDEALSMVDAPTSKATLPGVVAIDEIDAHLHPLWQHRIGDWFVDRFPDTQFFVTTHSPIICRAARRGSVWLLPAPGSDDTPRRIEGAELARLVDGNILDAYGTELFGEGVTRSPASEAKLDRLAILNRKRSTAALSSEEEAELESLRAALPTKANHTAPPPD